MMVRSYLRDVSGCAFAVMCSVVAVPVCIAFWSWTTYGKEVAVDIFDSESKSRRTRCKRGLIVVTGGAGFVGSHTGAVLLESGFCVAIIDDLSRGLYSRFETLAREANKKDLACTFHLVDIANITALRMAFAAMRPQPRGVLHLASAAFARESFVKTDHYYQNVGANTLHVLTVLREFNIRVLVFASSSAVYGEQTFGNTGLLESAPVQPVSPYGRAKLLSEKMIGEMAASSGKLKAANLRYMNVIGARPEWGFGSYPPKDSYSLNVRITDALFDAAERKTSQLVIGSASYHTPDGTAMRDYVDVLDVADANVHVLKRLLVGGSEFLGSHVYNVGSGVATSILELTALVQAITNTTFPVIAGCNNASDPSRTKADISKISFRLGWRPQRVDLTETLARQWAWRRDLQNISWLGVAEVQRRHHQLLASLVSTTRRNNACAIHEGHSHLAVPSSHRSLPSSDGTHVAILISGQLFRFLYKESLQNVPGGLRGLVCGNLTNCVFDIYIILAETHLEQWTGIRPVTPYTSDALSNASIEQYYLRQGANRVSVSILKTADNERLFIESEKKVLRIFLKRYKLPDLIETAAGRQHMWSNLNQRYKIRNKKGRWRAHGRMFLLRHLVHASMLSAERKLPYNYSHVLYLREDNVFWRKSDGSSSLSALVQRIDTASVAVDNMCSQGSYSDKIYWAGRHAADVLFSRTFDDFADNMFKWILWHLEQMQTEAFLKKLFESSGITVVKWPFIRADLRYQEPHLPPCISFRYFKCTLIPRGMYKSCPK